MTRIDEIKARLEAAAARLRIEGIQSLDPQAADDIDFLLTEAARLKSDLRDTADAIAGTLDAMAVLAKLNAAKERA